MSQKICSHRVCAICGSAFVGYINAKFCCENCRRIGKRMTDKNAKSARNPQPKQPRSHLDEKMRMCREQGISYADWQMQTTFAMIREG